MKRLYNNTRCSFITMILILPSPLPNPIVFTTQPILYGQPLSMNVTFIAMPIKTSLTLESSPCYAFTYFSNNIAIILYCTRTNLSINLLITPSQSNVTNKSIFCTSLITQFSQNQICCHICHAFRPHKSLKTCASHQMLKLTATIIKNKIGYFGTIQ